ncbi:uncharacterized protein LOC123507824 [Portunus trituberculatus]|uniref:Large ribosomal subunit protein bL34m n=1 Tax=Portunus trituberculatus TaxID=210409 RepID=A0A5B7ET40_PORTR|nr:uncharacterized protein LOC123507824 [Portunus trituberculatus]MPC36249.1 39S ribosomal protein L34, mitochondrial [Portunus trituberculatus]
MNVLFSRLWTSSLPGLVGGVAMTCRTLVTRPHLPHALAATPTPLYGGVGMTGLARPLLLPQSPIGGVGGRTNVRCHFPKPSEKRRIKRHGWEKRMSSFSGREILRRRILKGRHVLSH